MEQALRYDAQLHRAAPKQTGGLLRHTAEDHWYPPEVGADGEFQVPHTVALWEGRRVLGGILLHSSVITYEVPVLPQSGIDLKAVDSLPAIKKSYAWAHQPTIDMLGAYAGIEDLGSMADQSAPLSPEKLAPERKLLLSPGQEDYEVFLGHLQAGAAGTFRDLYWQG